MFDPKYSKNQENLLISQIRQSCPAAFKNLYYMYSDKIYNYFWYRLQSDELSKDFVQETFKKVWLTRDKLDMEKSICALLYRIASNLVTDHYRKSSKEQKFVHSHSNHNQKSFSEEEFETKDYLQKILDEFPEEYRLIFILNRYEGYKQYEIADMLVISLKTVESRMSKVFSVLLFLCLDF